MMQNYEQHEAEEYALVSSLYGPGTIACWYLTILSVLITWTVHPRKRKTGSIDVDLVAILTLPTVAAGHLVSQISTLMREYKNAPEWKPDTGRLTQTIAAIEAPFSVVESWMAMSVVLVLVALWTSCIRRAIAVAVIGLTCFAAESYVGDSGLEKLGLRYQPADHEGNVEATFTRSFVADFLGLMIAILVILSMCAATAAVAVVYALHYLRSPRATRTFERSTPDDLRDQGVHSDGASSEMSITRSEEDRLLDEKHTRSILLLTWIATLFLPSALLLCGSPASVNAFGVPVQLLTVELPAKRNRSGPV